MKKYMKISLCIIFFIIPFNLSAQFSIGAKSTFIFTSGNFYPGDLNDLNKDIEYTGEGGTFFGFPNIGILCNYSFNKYFAVQSELNYLIEGIAYDISDTDKYGSFAIHFIEIPFLVQLKTPIVIPEINAFIEAGISMKYRLLATHFVGKYNSFEEDEYNVSGHFNNVIIDGNIGIGLNIDIIEHFVFLINSRLRYDFMPVGTRFYDDKTSMAWSFDNIRFIHLTIFSFGVMYKFN